jgi:drug/metabolite transporter (DMT)-like permease
VLPQATPGQALAAMGACLLATLMYGYSATYARVRLGAVPPLALAAGSQLASALLLALPALRLAPATLPGPLQWAAALGLAVLCTGLAYVLFFRLIARLGPAQAISVTFVIPAFAMLWGALFLHEAVSPAMLAGCAVILLGTALAVGLLRLPGLRQPRPAGVKNGP